MNKLTINSTILLPRSNAQLPVFQLGVYQSSSVANSVKLALLAGYRGIDSATIYRNEEEVGHAVEAWKEDVALAKRNDTVPVSRDGGELLSSEIWLTSKITSKVR
jgi:diketogulonate reductase-like aldo/keto reductase